MMQQSMRTWILFVMAQSNPNKLGPQTSEQDIIVGMMRLFVRSILD